MASDTSLIIFLVGTCNGNTKSRWIYQKHPNIPYIYEHASFVHIYALSMYIASFVHNCAISVYIGMFTLFWCMRTQLCLFIGYNHHNNLLVSHFWYVNLFSIGQIKYTWNCHFHVIRWHFIFCNDTLHFVMTYYML